ncbi:Hypothetical predicted protein [Paramuricea clavata]|uniref:DDE Tnp4 domain-containing protein n=1 Tax=Paramuricea clavata TaxID=317549 RepID=A0A7D9K097_PARCT|nr:Hypothetical predicted protein [Paramuricea clavata]
MEDENGFGNILGAFICGCTKERRPKGPSEQRSSHWWRNGCENWTDKQFKKRCRVNRNTFNCLLQELQESIKRETTRFKVPVAPEIQLALTLYRLAHGCSFSTVGDLFGIANSTACSSDFFDEYGTLPSTEEEWKNELKAFLKDWGFPCVAAWDGFHVYICSNLKNFYSFKKRYSVTNMGLIASNKRFLWAGVGAPGPIHDSTLLKSSPIFNEIESEHVLPNCEMNLPGDSAFPARSWLMKAFDDTTKKRKERNFNKHLRAARVVSEHAYGMLKGRWRIIYKKTECRRRNVTAIIMACITLHNICIKREDPCLPRWQLEIQKVELVRKPTKRSEDKALSNKVRDIIKEWLWSLKSE